MNDQDPIWRRLLRHDVALALLAIVTGVAGAALAAQYLGARGEAAEAEVASRYQMRPVVVAAHDLEPGVAIGTAQMAAREMPQAWLPADAVPADRAGQLLGARTRIAVRKGTPLVPAAMDERGQVSQLSELLGANERALTLPVDDLGSQAGALRAGDRIDLYYTRNVSGDAVLMPLLEQVEVLAAGHALLGAQSADPAGSPYFGTVTLRVDVAHAPRVLLAQQAGQIAMLLRSPHDGAMHGGGVRHARELLQQPARAVTTRDTGSRLELLVGGGGTQTPERLLLPPVTARAGEAS